MKNAAYWAERMTLLQEKLLQKADALLPEMEKSYRRAMLHIQREIEAFYQRYAAEEGLTLAEAKEKLTTAERNDLLLTLEEYIEAAERANVDAAWLKKLNTTSARQRITRLEALELQMRQQIELLEAQKAAAMTKTLAEILTDAYDRTGYEVQRGLGIGAAFATLDTEKINNLLVQPWHEDGLNFSERIWGKDRKKLVQELNTTLTDAIICGESPQKTIDRIRKHLHTSRSNAGRLLLTEGAAFAARGRQEAYERLGVAQYQFLSALDGTTCEKCGAMDGKIFKREEYKIGKTAPPLHPHCRCTTVPYFRDEFTKDENRAARDADGRTYHVPADMTFVEWKERFVQEENGDIGETLNVLLSAAGGGSRKAMNDFRTSLKEMKDKKVAELFRHLADETSVYTSFKKNSYHKNGEIYLTKNVTHSAIAHELFHKLDYDFALSESGRFSQCLRNDYQRLQNIAEGYGGGIEDVLQSKYPDAFTLRNGRVVLKDAYRGISDILNGMSSGAIHLGYWHKDTYWKRELTLEKETWAQFGRILYQESDAVTEMLQFICDETYPEMEKALEEVMRDVLR